MPQKHRIARIEALAYRCPVERPVDTSFGRMSDRPAVFVRIEADDGCFGWGEVFANWPAAGAEHRVNLIERDIGPIVLGQAVEDPAVCFRRLGAQTRLTALQSGEWGPFRQVIAGIDTALWDLKARAAGLPLRRFLEPRAKDRVPAYASGIHIDAAERAFALARDEGFRAFKVKVGFELRQDAERLRLLARQVGEDEILLADANQAFDVFEAEAFLSTLRETRLGWFEEPVAADTPVSDWKELAASTHIPLAGGENLAGSDAFAEAIAAGALKVIQPDVAKWGGITGCLQVARAAMAAGAVYCPHFLGGGVGLAASAELLAAVGGDGLLEYDVNPNPLREAFGFPELDPGTGTYTTTPGPGLGITALPRDIEQHITHRIALKV
ncbi:mandelate racemase/muconate lactonizing enzyme family protein [Hoeflea sp.]|uniref:mandelate racemase/muconate lactonizing enzyme family protein n=1 Tax=Hoeflea sp. TaxID=1940281 RepID=UPI003B01C37D